MNPFRQANKLMQDMEALQKELSETEVTGEAGTGMVKVVMTCMQKVRSIKISPELLVPSDVEILEDLIVAALNDAQRKADEARENKTKAILPNIPGIPGFPGVGGF